jgi:phosphoglycolate phosphatase
MLIFDLDGTLVDTAPDLVATLNVVFEREGMPPVPYAQARTMIGGGARAMLTHGLQAEGRVVTPAKLDQLFGDFVAYYTDHVADLSQPFPGLSEALDILSARGHRFAVCTNKFERQSRMLLEALKLTHRFDAICGQDTFAIAKPDPEILRRTVVAAGIPVIAVDFGYSERPVSEYGPDRLISHFAQLPGEIAGISFEY